MWRIGFGLEKIGLAAQRRPVLFSIFIILLMAISAFNARKLSFDGSVISVLPSQSQAFQDYQKINADYRNFSRDVTILIESERLLTASGLEDLRLLQLEISLAEGVAQAVSIFSTPDFDPVTGEPVDWFPDEFGSDGEMMELIDGLIEKYPQVAGLYSREKRTAVIVASLVTGVQEDDAASFAAYRQVREAAGAAKPDDFKITYTGLTPIGATILSSLISDQSMLTVVGLLLGISIAFYIFRSFLAAVLCAVPPALTALWAFGLFSFFGVPINYLTTVLPTLALILAFADGIFLYFRWQTMCADNPDLDANLTEAITHVGPASSLTSLTTGIAFLSFSYADSEALKEFAFLGAGVVMLAFLAVIIALPLAIHWAIRLGLAKPGQARKPIFQKVGRGVRGFVLAAPKTIAVLGLAGVAIFASVQNNITAEYKLTHYLPNDSEILYGEELANQVIGGRALLLLSVPFVGDRGFSEPQNIERLSAVEEIVSTQFSRSNIFSANRVLETVKTSQARQRITELASEAPDDVRSGFLARDAQSALISIRVPSDMPVLAVQEETARLKSNLAALAYGNDIIVSGFPVLMSVEFTRLIDQLRASLMIAIMLGILFVGLATRSPFVTLAAITPNLLPIFFITTVLFLRGGTINLSEVVALTIAFGIAIDNAVHLINVYDHRLREGKEVRHALSGAIEEVGPALTAGTVIICVSVIVTQISSLPVVPVLGQLMIATLIIALLSNLFILPANILTLDQLRNRFRSRNTQPE